MPESSPSPDYAALSARELSDRELDAAIAERLFGWHGIRNTTIGTCGYRPGERPQPTGCGFSNRRTVPHYSGDPAAMMQVVEAMRARGFDLVLASEPQHWDAAFAREGMFGLAVAETAPRAICRAALNTLAAVDALAAASPATGKERAK